MRLDVLLMLLKFSMLTFEISFEYEKISSFACWYTTILDALKYFAYSNQISAKIIEFCNYDYVI